MENITDFDFYLKFTRPLILNLEKTSDKVLAAAWVKKLLDKDSGDEDIRLSYLKLLLFVLQRRVMAPPFSQHPNSVEVLSPLPEHKTLINVAKDILETEQQEKLERAQTRLKKESGDYPPYVSEFSADLLEYVAVQDIKNFGVHGYYAVSKLPLNTWYKVDKQFLPKAAKSMIEVTPGPPPLIGTASEPSIIQEKTPEKPTDSPGEPTPEQPPAETVDPSPEKPAEPPPEPPSEKPPEEKPPEQEPTSEETPSKKKRSSKKSTMGASPPSRPIGKVSPLFEEREPPTWGSNLLEVKDVIQETQELDLPTTPEMLAKIQTLWPQEQIRRGDIFEDLSEEHEDLEGVSPPESFASEDHPSFLSSGFIESEALDSSMAHGSPPLPFSPATPMSASSPRVRGEEWPSAASLPYATPPYPTVTPPPPGFPTPPLPKKRVPKVKPTRASLLLQKKKEEALAPPPPPPSKKPPRRPRPVPLRPSKMKTEEKEEVKGPSVEEEKKPIKKIPSKKGIPQLKGKKSAARKKTEKVSDPTREIIQDINISGEGFKGFDNLDDIDAHLQEYNQMLQEMEQKYRKEVEAYQSKWPEKQAEQQVEGPKQARGIPRPKRGLAHLAKGTKISIPKQHGVAVPLEQSIHISPKARAVLDEVATVPTEQQTVSPIRHPVPLLPREMFEEIEEETIQMATEQESEEAPREELEGEGLEEENVTKSAPAPGKDRRISSFYERMMSSVQMSPIAEAEQEDLEGEENIQQEGICGEVNFLEAAPATDDFEALEKMVEEEMQRRGEDPHAREKKKKKLSKKELDVGRKRFLDVHAKADTQLEQLTELEAVPEEMDFEELEKAMEQEMRLKGEDPHARAKKPKMSKKAFAKGRQRFLDVHAQIDSQLEDLELAAEEEGEMPPASPSTLKAELAKHKIYDPKRRMMRRSVTVKGRDVPLKAQRPGLATIHETPPRKTRPLDMKRLMAPETLARLKRVPESPDGLPTKEEEWLWGPEFFPPETRSPQAGPSSRPPSEPESIFPVGEQELEGLDDVGWVSGPEYFADRKGPISPYKDPRAKPAEEVFPDIDFGEEEKLEESFLTDEMLDDLLAESPPTTPDRKFKMMREVEDLYHELLQASPGLAGVPVTVPRPSASPRRPIDYSQITFSPPKSPPDPYGLPAVERHPTVDRFVQHLRKRQEQLRTPERRTPPKVKTPSPPPPSTPKDFEDDIFITMPPEEMADIEIEEFDDEYVSPLKYYAKLKETQAGLGADVSPPNKDWYWQMKERQKQFYGSPTKEVPDIFDVPYERVAGETPPKLVSPERPPLSPPIDAAQLREHIRSQATPRRPTLPYRRRVGPKHIVTRYSHPSPFLAPVQEVPDKEGLTQEDLDLQEYLRTMKKKKRGREVFRLPARQGKRKTVIQRHAPAPKLSPVKEDRIGEDFASPPKTVPDVFDLPDMADRMWTETPPRTFSETPSVSPPISPEDPKSWKASIQQQPAVKYKTPYKRTVGGKYKVRRKSPAPKLGMVTEATEYLDEEDLERRRFISQQGPVPRKQFPKISEPIVLSTVPEHIEYPDSPVSTRQIPASPRGTEGPRRRELRKRLKKRKLDFSLPSSPDEATIESEQLETEVGGEPERNIADLYTLEDFKLSPILTPPQPVEEDSPRTPPVNLLDLEEEPELMDQLLYVTPPSPMSQREAIERMKQEVREHQLIQRRHPRRKIRDEVRQRRDKLPEVEEVPLEEAAARIHEQIEAEVEAELAAQEAAQRERERSVLDEPVPAELPSPMKPQQQVPFYETPPHLRKVPQKVEKKIDIWPAKYRDVLTHEEMPELVSPEEPSPPLATAMPYFKKGVQYSPRGYIATQEERLRSPKLAEEEMPPDMASPTSPLTAEDIAKMQYESLLTPHDKKQRQKVNIASTSQITAEDIAKMSQLQYESLLTPDPKKQPGRQVNVLDVVPQSPELDMKKLTAPDTIRKVRRVPDSVSPMRRLQGDEWIWGPEFFSEATRSPQPGPSSRPDETEFEYEEKVVETKGPKQKSKKGKTKKKPVKKPEIEVEYDMDALQKLGLTEEDMQEIDLHDIYPRPPSTPQRPHPLPLPIKPQSPESPSPEHMAKMYAKLKEVDTNIPRYPMKVKGKYLPARYKDLPQDLPEVAESADENKPPSPMGWNMRWDLSPEARVNLRIPDIQVPESPLKTSRYEFERVELQEPPPTQFQQRLPLVMSTDQALLWPIAHELGLETDDLELGLDYTSAPQDLVQSIGPDVFDRIEKLEESESYEPERLQEADLEGFDQRMEEEEPPEDLGFEPPLTPPRPVRKSPEPVSPSKLKGELEMHQIYDPKRRKMRRSVKVKGRKVPLRIQYPGLETIYEGSPPTSWEELEAETDRQYQELMSTVQSMEQQPPSPPPAHPSSPLRPPPSPHRPPPSPPRPPPSPRSPPSTARPPPSPRSPPSTARSPPSPARYPPSSARSPPSPARSPPSPARSPPSPARSPPSPARSPPSPARSPPSPRLPPSPPPLPPSPPRFPTPSPERFKRQLDQREFDPELFHKKFYTMKSPSLSPPVEYLEDLIPSSPIRRVAPMSIPIPQRGVDLESEYPPTLLYAELDDTYEEDEEPDIWEQSFVDEDSQLQLYDSPPPSPKQEFTDEGWEPQIMEETPPFQVDERVTEKTKTPEQESEFASVYKGLIPSPKSPYRCQPCSPPFPEEGFGLPTVLGFEERPETPKRPMKKLPKRPGRRLKFDPTPTSPTSPETPEGPHVQVLEVEVQIHSPKKTPSPRPPTPPPISEEDMPSFMQEVETMEEYEVYDSPSRVPDNLIPFEGRTSPGILDTSPIHYEEDIPEHLRGFKWMDQ